MNWSPEWQFDGFGRLEVEKRPDGSQTTIALSRENIGGEWRMKQRTTTAGGSDDQTVFDSRGRAMRVYTHGPPPKPNTPRLIQVIEYDPLSGKCLRDDRPRRQKIRSTRSSPSTNTNSMRSVARFGTPHRGTQRPRPRMMVFHRDDRSAVAQYDYRARCIGSTRNNHGCSEWQNGMCLWVIPIRFAR
ncbi:MAG: hypothetical protein IPM54_41020 [Polyangiaceae bacterium]|nr:hypothetical protein [Polyangiaceae bacterium]